jgi:hypothetical protein
MKFRLAFVLVAMLTVGSGCADPVLSRLSVNWSEWDSPSAEYRPWVRWWWPGDDVEDEEILRETAILSSSFFGGAELQSFNAALNNDASDEEMARRLAWGSDSYWAHVRKAANSAVQNGIQLDVTLGSGWPVGGAHVAVGDSMQTLLWSEETVAGPATVNLKFEKPGPEPFYEVAVLAESIGEPMARYLPDECKVVEVMAAKKTGGVRNAADVYDLTDQLELDPASVVMLTDKVSADGKLEWAAPAGDWRVIGFYSCPDGEYVNLNALPAPRDAFAVDHFDADLVRTSVDYLSGSQNGLADLFGTAVRGVFVDSFELKTERHFTADFFDKFKELRGYDVRPLLPAVVSPGADNHIFDGAGIATRCPFKFSEMDERVARDYQQTVSDLFIERFIGTSTAWAGENGLKFRIQPYGLKIDVIKAAGAADTPETEQLYAGGSELAIKAVTSGGHQYGKNVISAESLVSSGRDYMTTPTKMKAWLDKLFTSGVNSVTYHGFPYKTGDAVYGITDWHAFSSPFSGGTYSENVSEANPFWQFMYTINKYVSRVQYALRQGAPQADLLVYYPYVGMPASIMALREHYEDFYKGAFGDEVAAGQDEMLGIVQGLFGGFKPEQSAWWLGAVWPMLNSLEIMGYTWEWTNDDVLSRAVVKDGKLSIAGATYSGVVVMRAPWMQPAAAANLKAMADAGLPVVVVGDAPAVQPGFNDYENGDAAVKAAFEGIAASAAGAEVPIIETPSTQENGNPFLFTCAGLQPALVDVGLMPIFQFNQISSTRMIHRALSDNGHLVFLRNPIDLEQEVTITTRLDCTHALLLDPATGASRQLEFERSGDAGTVTIAFPAYGSRIIACGINEPPEGEDYGGMVPLAGQVTPVQSIPLWTLKVTGDDVSGGTYEAVNANLVDWRDVEALKYSSSQGVYTAVVSIEMDALNPAYDPDAESPMQHKMWLNLGRVHGAALVSVNGSNPTEVIAEPFKMDVTGLLESGTNTIEVTVVPALRNRLVGLGMAKDPTAVQFSKKADTIIATGLLGPVQLEVVQ